MPMSSDDAAARTAEDLGDMDDKLRRLGLDVDHATAPSQANIVLQMHNSQDYIHSIRAAKRERQLSRLDRVARQTAVEEKQQMSTPAAAITMPTASAMAGSPHTEQTTAGDKAVLVGDAADAASQWQQKLQSERMRQIRADRILKAAEVHRQILVEEESEPQLASPPTQKKQPAPAVAALERHHNREQETATFCVKVAQGLVELAMEVSDNRRLPATGLGGRPVYRLNQDLSVTKWRRWVNELVFPPSCASRSVALGAVDGDGGLAGAGEDGVDGNLSQEAGPPHEAQPMATPIDLNTEATRCVTCASEAAAQVAMRAQGEAVTSVLAKLAAKVSQQRKNAEEAVRRTADEASHLAHVSATAAAEEVVATDEGLAESTSVLCREELLPGWTLRMPPAASLVYGDDLSGAQLLADTIDICVLHKIQQQQQQQQHPTSPHSYRRSVSSARHSFTSGDGTDPVTVDSSGVAGVYPSSAVLGEDALSQCTVTDIGIEYSDPATVESGIVVTYITPRTLMGNIGAGGSASDTRRSGPVGRAQRVPPYSTSGNSNALGGGVASQGGLTNTTSNPGGNSASRLSQRMSAAPGDGRREAELLIDAIVREVVRVHRHNLGVLVGDRMPSWAPSSPTTTASAASVETDGEVSEVNVVAPPAVVPLRTLFFIGFPDSASFADLFAKRLRHATEAAELEMMELEGRRRAAEQQAAMAAAAAAESTKQRSTAPTKGTKNSPAGLPRSKNSRPAKAVAGADELAVSSVVEELQATLALPPLSVLTTFLVYDLPTRQRRLEGASFASTDVPNARSGGGADDEDDSTTPSGAVAGIMRSVGPEYTHSIYHPSAKDSQNSGRATPAKTPLIARSTSVRFGGVAVASTSLSQVVCSPSANGPFTHTPPLCSHLWDVERLRAELRQQHAQQLRQRKDWAAAVVAATQRGICEQALGGGLRSTAVSFRNASRRRDKPTVSMNPNSSTAGEAERMTGASRRISMSAGSRTNDPIVSSTKAPEDSSLPRVLFFFRVVDVSDSVASPTTYSSISSEKCPNTTSLGTAVWCHALAHSPQKDQSNSCMEARALAVNELLWYLRQHCLPATGRILTNEALAPGQLGEPFRLGDYRLTDAACGQLRKTHEAFIGTIPSSPAPLQLERCGGVSRCPVTDAATDALHAEMEVWATLLQYAEQLYHVVAEDVFGDLDSRFDVTTTSRLTMLSTTAKFTCIDQSYASAKDAMRTYTTHTNARLLDCLSLLLRYSVDVCVSQLAASARLLCETIARHHRANPSVLQDATSPLLCDRHSVDTEILEKVPRLSAESAREVVDALRGLDPSEMATGLSGLLAKMYWPSVMAVTSEVVSQYFIKHSLHNMAGMVLSPSVASPNVPQKALPLLMENGEDSGTANPVDEGLPRLLSSYLSVEENVPAAVQLLLSYAVATPVPLARVTLLVQESLHMAQSVRDGAEAWVEYLYHEVLTAPTGGLASCGSCTRRPQGLDELADGPPSQGQGDDAAADVELHIPTPSAWRCSQLEVFLSSLRFNSPNGSATLEKLLGGLLECQLPRLWRFLPDMSRQLAERVRFPLAVAAAASPARPATLDPTAIVALPDTAPDAHLLTRCPCREADRIDIPFLTVRDVERLCAAAMGDASTSTAGPLSWASQASLDLEDWLANMALCRCCYCGNCAGEYARLPAASAPSLTSSALVCASAPSSGTLRRVITSLPPDVVTQRTQLCSTGSLPPSPVVLLPPPPSGEMPVEWFLTQWWWRAGSGGVAEVLSQAEDVQRCWALRRILLTHREATGSQGSTSTMAPSLLVLLRMLVGTGRSAGGREERVRRAFHCLAALRRVGDALQADTTDVDEAMSVEDDLTLTAEECATLGRLLRPSMTCPSTQVAAEATTTSSGGPQLDFGTDVQLLLQVEGTTDVTLPLLLSSRWAILMMREHF